MISLERFERLAARTPYVSKGIFYSEIYALLCACRDHRVTMMFESGVRGGVSTRLLVEEFRGRMMSIDLQPATFDLRGVQFVQGDSTLILPKFVERQVRRGVNVAVLIDGPKKRAALKLKDACLKVGARVVAVHDQHPGVGETRHTHDSYDDVARRLDAHVSQTYRAKYPLGSGLAIWEASQ